MNREEKILNDNEQLALKIADELSEGREFECDSLDIYTGAMKMADWKDQHPRKGLVDIEKVIEYMKKNSRFNYLLETDWEVLEDLRKAMDD